MPRPLVTLASDFGAGSGYPAQMKAVILRAARDAVVVDLSHDLPAHDVLAGALLLEACAPWFPDDAVHCAVVDPGVGTARRALAVVDRAGRRFVGPDNGLFTPFLGEGAASFALERSPGAPVRQSHTFHGRDLFAPVAAWLAGGGDAAQLGARLTDPVRLDWPAARREGDWIHGECLVADHFGNVITSIREADLGALALAGRSREDAAAVLVAGNPARLVRTFAEGGPGELVALVGSSGRLEIAIREGSAARTHGLGRGAPVAVEVRTKAS